MTVNVAAVNDAPVANADTLAATEDTPVTYTAAQLLGNDTDVDGDTLTIASVTSGTGGTAVLNGNGTVTFTPNANFNGAASFTYTATDGTGQQQRRDRDGQRRGGQRRPGCRRRHAGGDRGHAGHLHGGAAAGQRHRRRRQHADDRLGDERHRRHRGAQRQRHRDLHADANFNGAASFTYTVTDGTGHQQRRDVTVNVAAVNDAPVANDDTLAATEDTPVIYTAAQLLGNDTDVDGNPLTIASVTSGDRRHRGAQRQRHRDLHAGGELQRRGQLHLHGDRRPGHAATPRP